MPRVVVCLFSLSGASRSTLCMHAVQGFCKVYLVCLCEAAAAETTHPLGEGAMCVCVCVFQPVPVFAIFGRAFLHVAS